MSDRGGPSPREHLIAFASLLGRAVRWAWIGGIVFVVGLAGTATWAWLTQHLYRSEAVVVYERGVRSGSMGSGDDSARQVSTRLVEMLTARQRLEALIKQMKLYPSIVEQRNMIEAIDEMRKHISVSGRDSYTYKVSYDSDSREVAQRVLDVLVKGVVEEDNRHRLADAEETRKFLDTERKRADEQLRAKESTLSSFLNLHPQLAAEVGGGASAGATLRAVERERLPAASGGEIASLEMQAAQLEEAIVSAGSSPAALEPGGDPVLAAARARAHADLQAAQVNLADKQAHYTYEHPDVRDAIRRVSEAEGALRRSEAALAASRGAVAAVAVERGGDTGGGRAGALRRALGAVRSQISLLRSRPSGPHIEATKAPSTAVAVDTEWTRLNRDVSEARDRQGQLEAKQFQAQLLATLMAAGQGGRLLVADPAFRPLRPVAGGRFKIVALGCAVSLALAALTVILLVAFDDRLYGARDVERAVGDDVVVVAIPKLLERGGDKGG